MESHQLAKNQSGFVTRLFRGDVSLPITYWLFGVLIGNVAFQVVHKVIESNYIDIASSKVGSLSVIGFYWLTVAYNIFMLIAIWRSAGKYQGKGVWAGLARVAVVIGTIVSVGTFIVSL